MTLETNFWQAYQRFLKTPLLTEQPNPLTLNLAALAQNDLPAAYDLLRTLDLQAIDAVAQNTSSIDDFRKRAQQAARIILVGCGASGRIAMQIEHWGRSQNLKIEAVLAGGDITLIEAIESCEDSPEFARKQMALVNLTAADWVIGLSAGGEGPFILEALRFASVRTAQKPILICCNSPADLLERDAHHVAGDARIEVIPLIVGMMALTGSTRMQATTAMTLFLILGLFPTQFDLAGWRHFYATLDLRAFCGLTLWEAKRFEANERVTYHTQSDWALPILSDMTERPPTFNLPRLMHQADDMNNAHIALILEDADSAASAWAQLLGRAPKALDFPGFPRTSLDYLLGFDLSCKAADSVWKINLHKAFPECFDLKRRPGVSQIEAQFLLRLILVNHSTLVMGRCGFYQGNLMTSLKPSNFKLIDRTIRYTQFLYAQQTHEDAEYKQVAAVVFALIPALKPGESIVQNVLAEMLRIATAATHEDRSKH